MAYEVKFTGGTDASPDDPEEVFALGSIEQWGAFCAWAKGLPPGDTNYIKEFAKHGQVTDTLTLREQLDGRLLSTSRTLSSGESVAEDLIGLIGTGDEEETITVLGE